MFAVGGDLQEGCQQSSENHPHVSFETPPSV
jgi:hypothetical protein